ncbi:MAG: helix-turn-helix transcriptional regulator [Clostridia bacterium]|nr:helix-turn-helix transcriptional regulator [Clostridia bacterium]
MKETESSENTFSGLKSVHNHSNYEIFFVTNSSLSVVKGNDIIKCEESLLIIPPYVDHYRVGSGFEGYALNFNMEKKKSSASHFYEDLVPRLSSDMTQLPLTPDERFYISHIVDCLAGKHPKKNLQHFLYLLFSELIHRIKPQRSENEADIGKQAKYINKIETYIDRHYFEDISLDIVAKAVSLSTKQTSRIIKKEYGCSFTDLVTQQRLVKACMLLEHTVMRVREIAEVVGYRDSENYFLALFKKKYGMTPTQYRKSQKSGNS